MNGVGHGRGTPLIASELSPTLRAGGNRTGGDRPPGTDVDTGDSLIVQSPDGQPLPLAVRRLTPVECERLQGMPDNWTLIPHRGKPAADGSRYKAIGNSFAVPCIRWIGQQIEFIRDFEAQSFARHCKDFS